MLPNHSGFLPNLGTTHTPSQSSHLSIEKIQKTKGNYNRIVKCRLPHHRHQQWSHRERIHVVDFQKRHALLEIQNSENHALLKGFQMIRTVAYEGVSKEGDLPWSEKHEEFNYKWNGATKNYKHTRNKNLTGESKPSSIDGLLNLLAPDLSWRLLICITNENINK